MTKVRSFVARSLLGFPTILPAPMIALDSTRGYPPGIWRYVGAWHRVRFSFCYNPEFAYWSPLRQRWRSADEFKDLGWLKPWFMITQSVDREPFVTWLGPVGRSAIPETCWQPW